MLTIKLIVTIQTMFYFSEVVQCQSNPGMECFDCEQLNRHNSVKCVTLASECGPCLTGFIADEQDQNFCFALELVVHPERVIKRTSGAALELACEFNSKVECVWERNGQHVNVDGSQRYKFKGEGVNENQQSEDCTLLIQHLSAIDEGEWQCGSKATSSTISIKSPLIALQLIQTERLVRHPKEFVSLRYSFPVLLECVFNEAVECNWKHNSVLLSNVSGNYEYVDTSEGPKTDCSMRIKGVREADEGEWVCVGPHVESNIARLTINTDELIMSDAIIKEGISIENTEIKDEKVNEEIRMVEPRNEMTIISVNKLTRNILILMLILIVEIVILSSLTLNLIFRRHLIINIV